MISEERLRELWFEVSGTTLTSKTHDFARAVEREAYEAAAKVCETAAIDWRESYGWESAHAVDDCATTIRALAKKEGAA